MLAQPSAVRGRADRRPGSSGRSSSPALTANVGFWATLSLNIPDFSRYAYSQRDQVLGQALGLPTTMALFSFIGVAVTQRDGRHLRRDDLGPGRRAQQVRRTRSCWSWRCSRSASPRWRRTSPPTSSARPTTSPTSGPRWISFRIGGFITGVIGILMQPWKLVADPTGYIFSWLVAYSALLGRGRRRADRRLLRHPPHAARPGRPLPEGRPLLVPRRLQPAGAHRAGARHRALRARASWRRCRTAGSRIAPADLEPTSTTTPGSSASACRLWCTWC